MTKSTTQTPVNVLTIAPPPAFSPDKTKAEITLALSKEGVIYQNLLQESENVVFTKENLGKEVTCLKTLRAVKKKLEEAENPYTEGWKGFNAVRKSLLDPITELLDKKAREYSVLAREIEADRLKAENEKQRVENINADINTTLLTQSQLIAGAETIRELEHIEKTLASLKTYSIRFAEFLPDIIKRASELTPLIKEQKKSIEKMEALKQQEKAAKKSKDDVALLKIMSKKEDLTTKMEGTATVAQETAINQITAPAAVTTPEVIQPAAVKTRRVSWKVEIGDLKEAMKNSSDLLVITLNATKASEKLKTLKEAGVLDGKTEYTLNGIRYFQSVLY